jgi:hypothetical protein
MAKAAMARENVRSSAAPAGISGQNFHLDGGSYPALI